MIRRQLGSDSTMTWVLVICLTIVSNLAVAQEAAIDNSTRFELVELYLNVASSQGLLGSNVPAGLIGGSAGYLRQIQPEKPHFWGGRLEYLHLDDFRLTRPDPIDPIDLIYRTTSNTINFALAYRCYFPKQIGPMAPFFDASLGARMLYTFTTITFDDGSGDSDFNYDMVRWVPNLSMAGGLQCHIKDEVYATLRVGYHFTPSTTYLSRQELDGVPDSSVDVFEERSTPFTVINVSIGVNYWW